MSDHCRLCGCTGWHWAGCPAGTCGECRHWRADNPLVGECGRGIAALVPYYARCSLFMPGAHSLGRDGCEVDLLETSAARTAGNGRAADAGTQEVPT